MAWDVGVSSSSRETSSYVTNTIEGRDSARSSKQTDSVRRNGYDVVGINANQIGNMRSAINNYVNAIYKKIDEINTGASAEAAFRGDEVASAVKNYMETLKEYCTNLTSQLLAFSDKLAEVGAKWEEAAQSMSGQIGSSASSFNKGTKYTEQL